MKNTIKLASSNRDSDFVLAARRLWPMGFILAAVIGIAVSFAIAFGAH